MASGGRAFVAQRADTYELSMQGFKKVILVAQR